MTKFLYKTLIYLPLTGKGYKEKKKHNAPLINPFPHVGHTSQLWKCMDITDKHAALPEN